MPPIQTSNFPTNSPKLSIEQPVPKTFYRWVGEGTKDGQYETNEKRRRVIPSLPMMIKLNCCFLCLLISALPRLGLQLPLLRKNINLWKHQGVWNVVVALMLILMITNFCMKWRKIEYLVLGLHQLFLLVMLTNTKKANLCRRCV